MEKYCRAGCATDDNIIWHMCIGCWITKATNTHSEYVILVAFSLQQWLHEHTSARGQNVIVVYQLVAQNFIAESVWKNCDYGVGSFVTGWKRVNEGRGL
jgi:hypothetical protein